MPPQETHMSIKRVYSIASLATNKIDIAARRTPDLDLRVLVGHANFLDGLVEILSSAKQRRGSLAIPAAVTEMFAGLDEDSDDSDDSDDDENYDDDRDCEECRSQLNVEDTSRRDRHSDSPSTAGDDHEPELKLVRTVSRHSLLPEHLLALPRTSVDVERPIPVAESITSAPVVESAKEQSSGKQLADMLNDSFKAALPALQESASGSSTHQSTSDNALATQVASVAQIATAVQVTVATQVATVAQVATAAQLAVTAQSTPLSRLPTQQEGVPAAV